MATETTKDEWDSGHWFGSVDTLLAAARTAEAELREIDAAEIEEGERRSGSDWGGGRATVSWPGGSFAGSLDELAEAKARIVARDDVKSIDLHVFTPNYSASVSASSTVVGISVRVEGPRPTIVHGLVSTLQRKLEPGVGRVRQQPLEPFGLDNWLFLIFCWGGGAGFGYLVVHSIVKWGFDFLIGVLCAIVLILPVMGTVFFFDRSRPAPPTLQLVPEAEEEAPVPPPDDRGPILRFRDWLRRHPVLALGGTLALAVAANLITSAITS